MKKFKELDGSDLLTSQQMDFLKTEEIVADIKRRFELGEVKIEGITDPDFLIDAKEDKYLYALSSRSIARYLGKDTYDEFKLDELFGVSYSSLKLPEFESDVSTS